MKQLSGTRILSVFAAALMTVVFVAMPSHAADQSNGERLARRWCTSCHIVAPDQKGSTEAPPFAVIAKGINFEASKALVDLLGRA